MTLFEFTFALDQDVADLDAIDAFYGQTADASVATSEGRTLVHFDREADSLDSAIRSALSDIAKQGWRVAQITVDPNCVSPTATA